MFPFRNYLDQITFRIELDGVYKQGTLLQIVQRIPIFQNVVDFLTLRENMCISSRQPTFFDLHCLLSSECKADIKS